MTNAKHFESPDGERALCGVQTHKRLKLDWALVTCVPCRALAPPGAAEPEPPAERAAPASTGPAPGQSCPFCSAPAELAYGVDVFPHRPELAEKPFWVCWPCDARVGCHPHTTEPLGTLANAALRRLRSEVHELLDRRWLGANPRNRHERRGDAYAWLAKQMGVPETECHVGMFDEARCVAALRMLEGQG